MVLVARQIWRKAFPFLSWWPLVNRVSFRQDIMAGLTGAVVVLPQGIAFALIAGLPPEYGLYTAMVTPIVAALFGSSRHLISGPTTAISIVIFSTVSHHAAPGSPEFVRLALTMTFMAGVYQLTLGLVRFGTVVNFVSHSVIIGFTAGAAILIITGQLHYITGIDIAARGSTVDTWLTLFHRAGSSNFYTLGTALVTVVTAIALYRIRPRWPYMLIAMVTGSLLSLAIGGQAHGVAFVSGVPGHLPPPSLPDFSFTTIRQIASEAFAVALLGLIEAVSIARSVATRSRQTIDANQEFIGQGLSNIVGSFFSCYAGSGSFTRSGINYQAGAQTPLSAIFAALILAFIVFFIGPLVAYLALPAMAGVIVLVGYNLIDFRSMHNIFHASRSETAVVAVTFIATLLLELEFAIYAGVMLSLVFYLRQTSRPKVFTLAPDADDKHRRFLTFEKKNLTECPQLKIARIDGPLFFGAVDHVNRALQLFYDRSPEQKHLLVIADGVGLIDVAGAELLLREAERRGAAGGQVHLCGLKADAERVLRRGHYMNALGADNFFASKAHAIARIFVKLDRDVCKMCTARIFSECNIVNGSVDSKVESVGLQRSPDEPEDHPDTQRTEQRNRLAAQLTCRSKGPTC